VIDRSRVQAWLQPALDHAANRYTFEDVIAEVEAGEAHLWVFTKSAVVTRFLDEPAGRTFLYWLAGGDLDEIKEMEPHMTAWGQMQGCTRKMLVGRAGWQRALNWKRVGVVLVEAI
jgi:hypothetical protein